MDVGRFYLLSMGQKSSCVYPPMSLQVLFSLSRCVNLVLIPSSDCVWIAKKNYYNAFFIESMWEPLSYLFCMLSLAFCRLQPVAAAKESLYLLGKTWL